MSCMIVIPENHSTKDEIVIYVPVLCALCSVMRYYGPTVLIVGRKKPVFEGLKFFGFAQGPA